MRLLASYCAALRNAHKTLFAGRPPCTTSRFTHSAMATDVPTKDESAPHQVHHDYTVGYEPRRLFLSPSRRSSPDPPPPAQWLTKGTAASHTLAEITKAFRCTEQGAKNAMTRRGITHCKDWVHKGGSAWEKRAYKKRPAPPAPPVEFILGKRVFEDGAVEYKVSYTGLDDDHAHWEAAANLPKKAVDEYEEAHPTCA